MLWTDPPFPSITTALAERTRINTGEDTCNGESPQCSEAEAGVSGQSPQPRPPMSQHGKKAAGQPRRLSLLYLGLDHPGGAPTCWPDSSQGTLAQAHTAAGLEPLTGVATSPVQAGVSRGEQWAQRRQCTWTHPSLWTARPRALPWGQAGYAFQSPACICPSELQRQAAGAGGSGSQGAWAYTGGHLPRAGGKGTLAQEGA